MIFRCAIYTTKLRRLVSFSFQLCRRSINRLTAIFYSHTAAPQRERIVSNAAGNEESLSAACPRFSNSRIYDSDTTPFERVVSSINCVAWRTGQLTLCSMCRNIIGSGSVDSTAVQPLRSLEDWQPQPDVISRRRRRHCACPNSGAKSQQTVAVVDGPPTPNQPVVTMASPTYTPLDVAVVVRCSRPYITGNFDNVYSPLNGSNKKVK